MARYLYFPPDVAKFDSPNPALLDQGKDESADAGTLAAVGRALAAIHAATFQEAQVGHGDCSNDAKAQMVGPVQSAAVRAVSPVPCEHS